MSHVTVDMGRRDLEAGWCQSETRVLGTSSPQLLMHPDEVQRNMASTPPHNFSWVDADKVAGLALPRRTSEYQYLLDNGIKHLVCLCERTPPGYDSCPRLQLHHIDIVDFSPPSPAQIDRFLSIVEEANSKGEGVGVHCMHGHGRTGTMLACYLVKTRKMSGMDAISEIRRLREGSIETSEQEKAVLLFYQRNCCN
ncbi:dusp23 [Pungitius sinensis]